VRRRLPTVLRHRDFGLLWTAILLSGFSSQMIAVAIGWQVYEVRHNPLDLGLVGLAEFIPLPLLALPAGQLADRVSRRLLIAAALVLSTVIAAVLVVVTVEDVDRLWPYLAVAFLSGIGSALWWPAARALAPTLVPPDLLATALAYRSIAMQAATVAGPALGGLLFAAAPEIPYLLAGVLFLASLACTLALHEGRTPADTEPSPGLGAVLAGLRFVRDTPVIFGAISLDLFAVLFGGAVALLPVFASSILDVGPVGLGILRSAPAVGALIAGLLIARRPIGGQAGRKLLIAVGVFGLSMVVFGLSRSFALSCLALAVSGFVDMISMNIRSTTVALATPNELRGRVNAVEMVFISASNELGAFESGLAASILGATRAVVLGGLATIGIAASWGRLFPPLARVDRLEDVRPEPAVVPAGR
jgi:MFS family permease